MNDKIDFSVLIKFLLPKELTDYFTIEGLREDGRNIELFIEENNIPPEGYNQEELLSKGFHSPITIQDFPLRDRPVYLNIRRRRWEVKSTKKIISRDWNAVAHGTKLTQEFADFLKELFRQTGNKL